jgi:outer membrane protein assembly factor BamB
MFGKALAVAVLAASTVVAGLGPSLASSKAGRTGPADSKAALASSEVSPWSQTDSDPAASRANPAEHVLSPSAITKVKHLRSIVGPVIPPRASCETSMVAPALVGGDLYVITNARLSKYDAATGKLIWRRNPDPSFDTAYESLSVSGGLVVVAGPGCEGESQPGGSVYALNASTGARVWSRVFDNEIYQTVVDNGYVVAEGEDAAGDYTYVLSLSTGKTAWDITSCDGSPSSVPVPLVVDNLVMSTECVNNGKPVIEANNLATGTVVWSLHGSWRFQRGDLSGQQVYATNPAGAVVALNPQTGKLEYSLEQAGKVLAVDNSRAYTTCHKGEDVCAYNVSTGALEWRDTQLSGTPRIAAEADGVLYLDFGVALNAATGRFIKTIWVPQSNRRPANAIAVGDGLIAVGSEPRLLDLFGLPGS